jgi:DNA-binding XRE family transcriptional regulator
MNVEDINNIRTGLGMTQVEFAELIGVDRRTIINYEQGKKIPSTKVKLLQFMMDNGVAANLDNKKDRANIKSNLHREKDSENLKEEMMDLKDHIKTLKEFLEEKNKLAEMYRSENSLLKEKIIMLENSLKSGG